MQLFAQTRAARGELFRDWTGCYARCVVKIATFLVPESKSKSKRYIVQIVLKL